MVSNWIDSTYFCFSNSFLTRKNSELSSLRLASFEYQFKFLTLRVSPQDTLSISGACPVGLKSPLGWETRTDTKETPSGMRKAHAKGVRQSL